MNEDNPPMAFPNGYVYSREVRTFSHFQAILIISGGYLPSQIVAHIPFQALEDMAAKNDGHVVCPDTGDSYEFSKLKKVFIS